MKPHSEVELAKVHANAWAVPLAKRLEPEQQQSTYVLPEHRA
jgi:hypothetical protein